MFPGVIILLLKSFHVDSRSEFQRRCAAYSVISLVEGLRTNGSLSEDFHFICPRASDLFPCRCYFDLWTWLNQGLRILLCVLFRRCLLYWLSWPTSLSSCPNHHFWKGFLRCDSFQKLFFINLLVCIEVNSPNNRIVVLLTSLLSCRVEESLQVLLVDVIQAAVIHSFIGRVFAVAFGRL